MEKSILDYYEEVEKLDKEAAKQFIRQVAEDQYETDIYAEDPGVDYSDIEDEYGYPEDYVEFVKVPKEFDKLKNTDIEDYGFKVDVPYYGRTVEMKKKTNDGYLQAVFVYFNENRLWVGLRMSIDGKFYSKTIVLNKKFLTSAFRSPESVRIWVLNRLEEFQKEKGLTLKEAIEIIKKSGLKLKK
jgi:hypothetical protein